MNTQNRHLILLTTDFKPIIGGIAEYLHHLWDCVSRHHPVTVMTCVPPGEIPWAHSYRLKVLPEIPQRRLGERFGDPIPPLRKIHTTKYFYDLGQYAQKSVAAIRENYGKHLQVFIGLWSIAAHFWCRELRRAGIPYSLHAHGLEAVSPLYGRLPRWRQEDFQAAQEVLANSRGTAALVKSIFGEKVPVYVVNPGVGRMADPQRIENRAIQLRKELNLHGRNVLLTVGRLVPRKGVDLVLASVKEIIANFPGLHYVVVGDGPERSRLHELTKKLGVEWCVHFLGQVDEIAKWAMYKLCDVFVMPNRLMRGTDWEGFGIVFLEAGLLSRPSIGGNNGGVSDAIEHEVTGFLVDPENPKEISLCLTRLLSDPGLRQKMGQAAAERARTRFNWDSIAADFCGHHGWTWTP